MSRGRDLGLQAVVASIGGATAVTKVARDLLLALLGDLGAQQGRGEPGVLVSPTGDGGQAAREAATTPTRGSAACWHSGSTQHLFAVFTDVQASTAAPLAG